MVTEQSADRQGMTVCIRVIPVREPIFWNYIRVDTTMYDMTQIMMNNINNFIQQQLHAQQHSARLRDNFNDNRDNILRGNRTRSDRSNE